MDINATLIKLKPDSKTKVNEWKNEIERLNHEAIQSIKNEGFLVESWFQAEINNDQYLLAYIRSDDIKKAQEVAKKSDLQVDKIHQQFKKDAWDQEIINFKLLVDIEAD